MQNIDSYNLIFLYLINNFNIYTKEIKYIQNFKEYSIQITLSILKYLYILIISTKKYINIYYNLLLDIILKLLTLNIYAKKISYKIYACINQKNKRILCPKIYKTKIKI